MNIEPFPNKLIRSNGHGMPVLLSDEQKEWLRKYYPITSDQKLAHLMGIAYMTVRRMAAKMGLSKDKALLLQVTETIVVVCYISLW